MSKITRWVTAFPPHIGDGNVEVMPVEQHRAIVARHVGQETPMQAEIERLRREVRFLQHKQNEGSST